MYNSKQSRNKMYRDEVEPLAVQIARETLEMYHELVRLRDENEKLREYRKLYIELLNADIEHSRHMLRYDKC